MSIQNPEEKKEYLSHQVQLSQKKGPIDVIKHRWFYLGFSLLILLPGLFFIIQSVIMSPNHSPVRLGIDFTGGSMLEYGFEQGLNQEDLPVIRQVFDEKGYTGSIVQIQSAQERLNEAATQTESISTIVSIRTKELQGEDASILQNTLAEHYGNITLLQKNSIGPALAKELLFNGAMALTLAYILIVGYLTFRFQFDYAVCAIIALVYDTLFVIGAFSLMGHYFHTEIDSLFITGLLTVIGFSVHDSIVVFDRLRENSKVFFTKKLPFGEIANMSVNQTLARSINTSLTTMLVLFALYFWGGETTKDFVLCMILGIGIGTYSSIFVASAILTWWRERNKPEPLEAQPSLA